MDSGRLLNASFSRRQYERIPAAKACRVAQEAVDERIESQDAYAIPLFEPEAPIESDAFVVYRTDADEVKFFDSGDTSVRWVSTDVIATTELGQRLQWWLPEVRDDFETLDEERLPTSTVQAIDSVSDDEANALFSEMHDLVREERDTQKRENRDRYTDLGLENAIDTGPLLAHFYRSVTLLMKEIVCTSSH